MSNGNSGAYYFDNAGNLRIPSMKSLKHSIRVKSTDNILDRFKKINVYTFGMKENINDKLTEE